LFFLASGVELRGFFSFAMATVVGTMAMAGSLMRLPQPSLALSSTRASFPGRLCLCSFRSTGRLQLQSLSSWQRRPLFVSQKSAQSEARQAAEDETEEEEGSTSESDSDVASKEESVTQSWLQGFREALAANDEAAIADLEAQFEATENDRVSLAQQLTSLTEEISASKDRFLRLNADFDNYRKRAERDRLSTAANVRGEVIESLLPMVDNFERAKTSIKTETEGEQKIDNSYQGIYKQFVEIMKALGVVAVDTVGKEFDPKVH
jgi:molecular chaperone GrpE